MVTGNWPEALGSSDHCLKMALQWIAASVTKCPQMFYYADGDLCTEQVGLRLSCLFALSSVLREGAMMFMEIVSQYHHHYCSKTFHW